MTNENLIAILDVIKGLKEDVFQKIDELKEDVEEKINKLCSDQERNRDELVRLNTHMIYVQSSIADIKQDTSTQVSQAKDLVIALEHKIEKSLEQESCARKRALEEQQENMGTIIDLKFKNTKLNYKIVLLTAGISVLIYIIQYFLTNVPIVK